MKALRASLCAFGAALALGGCDVSMTQQKKYTT
jgi:hypothetical protein